MAPRRRSRIDEHLNVAKAILAGDADAAEAASRRFLLVVHREMLTDVTDPESSP